MNIEQLEQDFLTVYQKNPLSEMIDALDEFLHKAEVYPYANSLHWVYLNSQVKRLQRERKELGHLFPVELPGMVYGMFYNAWTKLLAEIKNDTADNQNTDR